MKKQNSNQAAEKLFQCGFWQDYVSSIFDISQLWNEKSKA